MKFIQIVAVVLVIGVIEANLDDNYEIGVMTGGWGGSCTCPNGEVYLVADNGDNCDSMACIGGVSGNCNNEDGPWSNNRVTCAAATVEQCSTDKFGINFCDTWCNADTWDCGTSTLGADDDRNTDNVDYTCDCSQCNECSNENSETCNDDLTSMTAECDALKGERDALKDERDALNDELHDLNILRGDERDALRDALNDLNDERDALDDALTEKTNHLTSMTANRDLWKNRFLEAEEFETQEAIKSFNLAREEFPETRRLLVVKL